MQIWYFLSRQGSNPDPPPTADAMRRLTFFSVASEHCSHSLFVPSRAPKKEPAQLRIHLSNFQNNHNTLENFLSLFFPLHNGNCGSMACYFHDPPPTPPSFPPPFPLSLLCGFPTAYTFFFFSFQNFFVFFLLLFFFPRVLRWVGGWVAGGGRVLLRGPVSERTTRRVHLHVCSVSALCLRSINNPDGGNCCTVTCHT